MVDLSWLYRKKPIDFNSIGETKLARVLNTFDLTALGIGSTLGAGIYVIAGSIIKDVSGPSVVISFVVAAIASILAGLCYAEFGARVPKTGSAYVYTYVTIGEFLAFIIGWNLILEYVIGTSSVARAFSTYFDSLIENQISQFFQTYMPMNIPGLSPYPDFFACTITLLITLILAVGVKESSILNNIFTGVNMIIIVFVLICGGININFHNWQISPSELPYNWTNKTNQTLPCNSTATCGEGGFFPFGVSGMIAGAAKCFYAFVGFDIIATTGEEVKNPQKAIPLSIVLALLACAVAYCGVSSVLSLMVPYYMIDINAPLPTAFLQVGLNWARYFVAIGAICSLSTSLLGAMFPLPRIIYAMASDGLIFKFLANVNSRLKTPLIGTFLSGLLAAIMATLFDLNELVNMMSIGTLLAYSLVAISVLVLRYQPEPRSAERRLLNSDTDESDDDRGYLVNNRLTAGPTEKSSYFVNVMTFVASANIVVICLILVLEADRLAQPIVIGLVAFFSFTLLIITFAIWIQPQNSEFITFQMPLVPVLPLLSCLINFYLMANLSTPTWIRFAVWMAIGFLIYFGYGIFHSGENKKRNRGLDPGSSSGESINHGVSNTTFVD